MATTASPSAGATASPGRGRHTSSHVLDQITIGPEAAAVLEFTSDVGSTAKKGEIIYITSKDAYIWAGLATVIARSYVDDRTNPRIDDITLHSAIFSAVNTFRASIVSYSEQLPRLHLNPAILFGDYVQQRVRNYEMMLLLLSNLQSRSADHEQVANEIELSIKKGYSELRERSLISDPVIETTLGLAILSLVPFSFVRRTKKGRLASMKITAALWKYEWSRKTGDRVQLNLTLEVARIAKSLKAGIIAAYHQATKGEGDEPEHEEGDEPEE